MSDDLVEKVARVISDACYPPPDPKHDAWITLVNPEVLARAAIKAVLEWMREDVSARLEEHKE